MPLLAASALGIPGLGAASPPSLPLSSHGFSLLHVFSPLSLCGHLSWAVGSTQTILDALILRSLTVCLQRPYFQRRSHPESQVDVNLGGHSSIHGSPGELGRGPGPGRRSEVFAGWAGQVHPLLLIFRKQGFTFLGNFPPTSRPTFFVGQWGRPPGRWRGSTSPSILGTCLYALSLL